MEATSRGREGTGVDSRFVYLSFVPFYDGTPASGSGMLRIQI